MTHSFHVIHVRCVHYKAVILIYKDLIRVFRYGDTEFKTQCHMRFKYLHVVAVHSIN